MAGSRIQARLRLPLVAVALLMLSRAIHAQAPSDALPQQPTVVDVKVAGNRETPLSKVMQLIATRPGRPLDPVLLEKDVKALATKGGFANVRTLREPVPGGIIITFQVIERPTLKYVKYLGCVKLKSTSLAKQTMLKKGDPLDPYSVEEGRRKIEEYYKERGYNSIRVTVMEGTKVGDRGAVYVINEGQSQKVWKVQFVGNTIASDARLRTQIQSKAPILYLFKGYVERKKIDEDVDRLTAYYRSLGFFRARIGRELDWSEKQNWLTLTFVVDEGPRYQVRNVSFMGNTKFASEQLDDELQLQPGQFFDQTQMTKDLGTIRDLYGGVGYIFADVQADPRFLEEPGQLDLIYNVVEGDRYRVGRINVHIEGDNPHTRHTTVLNRMSIRPGDIVDIRQLRASERRIKASGLFLNDPTRGIAPKIVFNPPDSENSETGVVRKPKAPDSGFRGQSPDPPRPFYPRYMLPPGANQAAWPQRTYGTTR